jgi:S1-C subfamily serine protease/regulator of sirC expression with transglutaminase-like and TPR domain
MPGAFAAEPPAEPASSAAAAEMAKSVEELAKQARPSVVVIKVTGRDGSEQGLGTGFVVSSDGLIATNLHVIGEARPIAVQMADGKRYDVTSVHASDRSLDLALIKIDAQDLPKLELGEAGTLVDGQPVVAVGNPIGLEHSVVAGVVSGKREIDGRSMIQLAIPIEPGNSGGPLLDMQGRVRGILTMKSLVTANLGFAVQIDSLKPLIEKPNPVPMTRWLTIGTLDARQWTTLHGGRWRQRAGRILADAAGQGFGGRSLCLATAEPPERPYEVAVTVKLDNEAGAAGLAFASDGGDKHYGFYPSAGRMRLTRFDGSDVYSWHVLHDQKSEHYRPGDWNTLKVRVEQGKILAYVNDHLVVEVADDRLTGGKAGLAKFRQTQAEFKNFRLAKEIPAAALSAEIVKQVLDQVGEVSLTGHPDAKLVAGLATDASASGAVLAERAKNLEQQAAQLRRLAQAVHQQRVQSNLEAALSVAEEEIDLFHAGLLIAQLDNAELDVDSYRAQLNGLAEDLKASLPADADERARIAALNAFLFQERGFHGSRGDYYNRANSYLNEVLDDREGLPITLAVVYIELARRIGLNVVGVGLPGHFVVRHIPKEGEPQLIDVFEGGQALTPEDAAKKTLDFSGQPIAESHLAALGKRAIIVRMLHNLLGIATRQQDAESTLRYLNAILTISPELGQERWFRAVMSFQTGRRDQATTDVDWLLAHQPAEVEIERVQELKQLLQNESP